MLRQIDGAQKYTISSFLQILKSIESEMDVTTKNSLHVVSLITSLTEALVWSEQNNACFFDTFIDSNIIETLNYILMNHSVKQVTIQLLHCSSVLIHNLSDESSKNYLISSQFFSDLISNPYDLTDEEIVVNYTSMLKGLSVNLTKNQLIHLVVSKDFSLFTSALMFFNQKESLVKTAVRTVVINILRLNNGIINEYVMGSGFFYNLANCIRDSVSVLGKGMKLSLNKLEELVQDVNDTVYYVNDIMEEENENFNRKILTNLKQVFLFPVICGSLSNVHLMTHHVPNPIALFISCQLLNNIKNSLLREFIANIILSQSIDKHYIELMQETLCDEEDVETPPKEIKQDNIICQNLQMFLRSKDDDLVALALCLILSVLGSVDSETLKEIGLLPGKNEIYFEWLETIGDIIKLNQGFIFFTFLAASKCLCLMASSDLELSHSIIIQIFKENALKFAESLLKNSGARHLPQNFPRSMKTQWEFVKNLRVFDRILIPLNFLSSSLDETNIPLEYRRCLVDSEGLINEMRFFWLYRKFLRIVQGKNEENTYPISASPIVNLDNRKVYSISDEIFRDKPKIMVSVKEKKKNSQKILVRDENYFILLSPHGDSKDLYVLHVFRSLTQVVLPENSNPKVCCVIINDFGKVEMVFEDSMTWLSIKNFYEKSVKNAKINEIIEIQNFLREQKNTL